MKDNLRDEMILKYHNLVYKILSHYRRKYRYNSDFEEEYYHEGILTLIQAGNTYKEASDVKFITYATRCIHNRYRDIFKEKKFRFRNQRKFVLN